MKRPLRRSLLGTAGLAAAVYLGVVALLAANETAMVYPGAEARGRGLPVPAEGSVPWDTLRVRADDGTPVLLLTSTLSGDALWALYLHGNGSLIGSGGNVARYRMLRAAGFNVVAVEYRGFGASAAVGPPSEAGLYADGRAAWAYLTGTLGVTPERIVLYGWSLGSGVATYLAARHAAAGLITEGAYTRLPDVGQALYPWLPVSLVMRNRFDNLGRAGALDEPWLVFHGRDDTLIPFSHAEALAAASDRARLVPLDAGHNDGVMADERRAAAALRRFAADLFAVPHGR